MTANKFTSDSHRFDGQLLTDEISCEEASVDFGHLVKKSPRSVLYPGSVQDIVDAMELASSNGMKVAGQGRRHSVFGRSQTEDGIVIDMSGLAQVYDVTQSDRGTEITVEAGATWRDVFTASLTRGFTPPVLPEYLDLSVGGTIIAGGIGGTSWRNGTIADNALELRVVTGDGRRMSCSREVNADLFDVVRAGLGQVAIVVQATLRLVPAPLYVRRYQLMYPDLSTIITDQRLLIQQGRWDYLQGAVTPHIDGDAWLHTIDGSLLVYIEDDNVHDPLDELSDDRARATITSKDYPTYAKRFDSLEASLRQTGNWDSPHPWLFTFLGQASARNTIEDTMSELSAEDLGEDGRIAVSPLFTNAISSPLFRMPSENIAYTMNLFRYATPQTASEMVSGNRRIYEHVRSLGGTLNPVSALPMTSEDWEMHFGAEWERIATAKKKYDPNNVLTPGYEVFEHIAKLKETGRFVHRDC